MRFKLAIDKTQEETVVATVHERSCLTDEMELLVLQHDGSDRIAAYTEDGMRMLPFSDIECITVLDGKTYAVTRSGERCRLKLRLYELEAMLPASFIRINKSALANEAHLERFTASFNGAVDAVFRSGYREYVSRRCFAEIKKEVRSRMKQYCLTFLKRGLLAASGGPLILAMIYGILGANGQVTSLAPGEVCMGIVTVTLLAFIAAGIGVVYQIERLPLLSATAIHAGALYLDYLLIYLLNNWIPRDWAFIGVFTLCFAVGYALIWGIILLSIRHRTNRINRHLRGGK